MNFDVKEWPALKEEVSTLMSSTTTGGTSSSSSSNSCLPLSTSNTTASAATNGSILSHHNFFNRRSSLVAVTEEDEKSVGSSCSENYNNKDDLFFSAADDTSVRRRTMPLYRQSAELAKDSMLSSDDVATSISSISTFFDGEDDLQARWKWWPSYTSSNADNKAMMLTPEQPKKRSYLDLDFKRSLSSSVPPGMVSPAPSLAFSELSYGAASSPFAPSFADAPLTRPKMQSSSSSGSIHGTNSSNKSPQVDTLNQSWYADGKSAPNHDNFFTPIREDDEFTSFLSARCSSVSTIGSDVIKDRVMTPLPQCRPSSNHSDSVSICEPCLPLEDDEGVKETYCFSMFNRQPLSSDKEDTSFRNDRIPPGGTAATTSENFSSFLTSRADDKKDERCGEVGNSSPELWKTPVKLGARVFAHYHTFEYDSSKYPDKLGQHMTDKSPFKSRTTPQTVGRASSDFELINTPLHANKKNFMDYDSPSRYSPLPQNLRGDPNRQAKVKTELCRSFSLGLSCPFGTRCNYAHGEDELKYTTLFELKRADLVSDIESYRAFPCFSFVATGACPYGLRCGNIHDPRVAGVHSSWLPHSEVPVSSLDTDMNVDKTHHELLASLSQENSLLPKVLWDNRPSLKNASFAINDDDINTEWRDVYALVCNLANLNESTMTKSVIANKSNLSELQRLCIALHMNVDINRARGYIYKPRHLIYNELCMVLRTKYFKLLNPQPFSDTMRISDHIPFSHFVEETSLAEYKNLRSLCTGDARVVVVHELAFGCAGEQAARVSLWFNLDHVTEMSIADVKKYKRQKQRARIGERMNPIPGTRAFESDSRTGMGSSSSARDPFSFATHPHKPFFYSHPINNDEAARNLVTDILYHRLSVLVQREFRCFTLNDAESRSLFASYDHVLMETYFKIKANIQMWRFPVSEGLEVLTEQTPVPKCNSHYVPSSNSFISSIWSSFAGKGNEDVSRKSLDIFYLLRQGNSLSSNSRCISLMNSFEDSIIFKDEWKMIQEHYQMTDQMKYIDDGAMPLSPSQIEKRM